MTLSISILLALVVFLLLISKILPPTSTVIPLIAKYLLFTFIMNIITIFCTVVIINYNYRTPRTNKMPYWMRRLFIDILPRILCMERPHKYDRDSQYTSNESNDKQRELTTKKYIRSSRILSIGGSSSNETAEENSIDFLLTKEIYEATEDISFIANQMRSACRYEEVMLCLMGERIRFFLGFSLSFVRFVMIGNILHL